MANAKDAQNQGNQGGCQSGCGNINSAPVDPYSPRLPDCAKSADPVSGCCLSPPEKMTCPKTKNDGCEKIELSWAAPTSCQKVEATHIQVRKGNNWIDMPKVPPTWTSWSISNNHLRNPPISLPVGMCAEFRIRSFSCNGWSEWSNSSGRLGAKVE